MDEKASRRQNIEITELKNDLLTCSSQLKSLEEQLSQIDQDQELSELLEALQENSGQIKGFFSHQMDQFNKDQQGLLSHKTRCQEDLHKMEEALGAVVQLIQEARGNKVRFETLSQRLETELEHLEKELIEPYENEQVEKKLIIWKERFALLQNQIIKRVSEQAAEAQEKETLLIQLKDERKKKEAALTEQNQLIMNIDRVDSEQEKLSQQIEPYMPTLAFNHSLYEKQSSIETILIEKEVQQAKRKEAALKDERLSGRLVDHYGEADIFTADILLTKLVEELKAVTTSIELGSKYFAQVQNNIRSETLTAFELFPYWAITLITTDKDLEIVKKRVDKYRSEITHPVLIMTLDEVRALTFQTQIIDFPRVFIYPELWSKNLKMEAFEAWKADLHEKMKDKQSARLTEENALAALIAIRKQTYTFFSQYPYEDYQALKKAYESSKKLVEELSKHIHEMENRVLVIDQNAQVYGQKIQEYKDESYKINQKMVSAGIYLNKVGELHSIAEQYTQILKAIEEKDREKQLSENSIKEILGILDDIKGKTARINNDREKIEGIKQGKIIFYSCMNDCLQIGRSTLPELIKPI